MLDDELIRFRDGKFYYKANMKEVENIRYKKKYWDDLGIEDPDGLYFDEEEGELENEISERKVEAPKPVAKLEVKTTETPKIEEQV
jgi:hypothetical protein